MTTTRCPNCASLMTAGDPCPECDHDPALTWCPCQACVNQRSDADDELDAEEGTP